MYFLLPFLSIMYHTLDTNAEEQKGQIIGGEETQKGRYSYIVGISRNDNFCSGTLIAPSYVLSAAHCYQKDVDPQVMIGRHNMTDDSESYEIHQTEYEVIHPDFNCFSFVNDIMLIKLKTESAYEPVKYDDTGAFVEDLVPGEEDSVKIIGWGKTQYENNFLSPVLMEADLEIISNSECDDIYYDLMYHRITDDMMCATQGEQGICNGDSGGPLIIPGENATGDVQVGIISHGKNECEDSTYPGVYSRISSNMEFINCVLDGGSDECSVSSWMDKLKRLLRGLAKGLIGLII